MFDHTLAPACPSGTTALQPGPAASPAVEAPPRLDLYVAVHKALRSCLSETLVRLGRIDVADPVDRDEALEQLEQMLGLVVDHLDHEDRFIHPAIESRQPHGATIVTEDHLAHVHSIAMLRFGAAALRQAAPTQAVPQALSLYRHLSRFVADTLLHFDYEETTLNALLWQLFSDDELGALHERLRASIAPQDMMRLLRWALPAGTPAERAELIGMLRAVLPPEAMRALLAAIGPHLDAGGWKKLRRAAGIGLELAGARPTGLAAVPRAAV